MTEYEKRIDIKLTNFSVKNYEIWRIWQLPLDLGNSAIANAGYEYWVYGTVRGPVVLLPFTTCHHFGTSTHRSYWIHVRAVSCRTGVLVLAGVFLRHVGEALGRTESILDLLKILDLPRLDSNPGPHGSQVSTLPLCIFVWRLCCIF